MPVFLFSQLKSELKCRKCGYGSVRFDPFTFLSLPLPMEEFVEVEVICEWGGRRGRGGEGGSHNVLWVIVYTATGGHALMYVCINFQMR